MISKNQIKFIRSLQLKKNRDVHNCFIVEGEKMVEEILQSDFVLTEIFTTRYWNLSIDSTIKIHRISEKELERIRTLKNPNELLAIVEKQELA